MIQRIQSLFFLLTAVLMAVTIFSPLAEITDSDNSYFVFSSFGIGYSIFDVQYPTWGIISLAVVSTLLPLVNIFLYKNRKAQIKLGWFTSLLILFLYLTIYVYYNSITSVSGLSLSSIQYGFILPFIALIFNLLAVFRVKKDEVLVRSTDRIR